MMSLLQGSNLWFTIAFVVVAVMLRWRRVPWSAWGGVYVSLGILGTFWGILIALLGFDVANVERSVPILIDGMKTAFATSVVGTTVAITTRLVALLRPIDLDTGAPSAQDYLVVMRAQTAALEAIRAGIGGENDSSLLVQVQKLRLDMKDFMEKLTSGSTEAIVEALKGVIKDFNTKINEQFGDNFKQLNEAVGRLVTWMQEHQALVTKSHEQLTQAVITMDGASRVIQVAGETLKTVSVSMVEIRTAIDATARTTATIPPTLEKVRLSLAALGGESEALARNIAALGVAVKTLGEANTKLSAAMEAWTNLAKEVPEASESIGEMVEAVRAHSAAVTEQQRQLIETLKGQVTSLATDLKLAQKDVLAGVQQVLTAEVETLSTGLRKSQVELLHQLQKALAESGTKNQIAIERQITALDEALGNELSAALQLLGGKLGSLSQQFVNDYGPLTERLAQIVHLAEQVEAQRRAGVGRE